MMPPKPPCNPVPELIRLLGAAVLLACPAKTKKPQWKWGHLTLADMTPEYLARLKDGNIGVALGGVSGGLCAIDIDDDGLVEPFMAANLALANTFQTHGSRGRVFWIRCKGRCPKTIKLKTSDGEPAGEFRANGTQSIVWGIHPDGQPYQWVVSKPAIEIDPGSITWSDCFTETVLQSDSDRDTLTEDDSQEDSYRTSFAQEGFAEASDAVSSSLCASASVSGAEPIKNREDVLRLCTPTKVHENNELLFKLARGVLNLERLEGRAYSIQDRLNVFTEWFKRSLRFLRPGQSRDSYLAEFMNAKKRAKTPLGGNTIDEAWALAQCEPLPPEAAMFEEKRNQQLIALCFQLQRLNGDQSFFLSSRVCQRLLGLETAHEAAKWLTALQEMGVIELTVKGNARQATRYRYCGRWLPPKRPTP